MLPAVVISSSDDFRRTIMKQTNRREFIKTATATVAAVSAVSLTIQTAGAQSASDKLRIACIGVGGRGSGISAIAATRPAIIGSQSIDEPFMPRIQQGASSVRPPARWPKRGGPRQGGKFEAEGLKGCHARRH